ncbi:hypothetical protein CCR75_009159 [Bremia lactucae]|uniref:Prolyl endopeptidase n=1 Tax=Bremia lactucae TaxID=4779 RepID=A0A976IK36_BRELC|nr:hypothetical protein CCR75_009159 [Bremia lactucae]
MNRQIALNLSVGAGACLALYIVRLRRAAYSKVSMPVSPPLLDKRPKMVPFGAVAGQNRGLNPMKPILYLEDPYFYVRDDSRKKKEILGYLRKENEYTENRTRHLANLRSILYDELLSHVQETDEDYPYPHGPNLYYKRTVKGRSYPYHCRKAKTENGPEEILLDENEIAAGHKYCQVASVVQSPDHRYLAYMVDFSGCETYAGYIKDTETGELLSDRIENISSLCWGKDASILYYATQDGSLRQSKLWCHHIGSKVADELLYTEDDEMFNASFQKARSGKYIFLISSSSETSEVSFIDTDHQSQVPQLIAKRRKGLIYSVDHFGDSFFIVTNKDNASNFKLMRTPVSMPSSEHWVDVFPYDESIKVDDIDCFKDFMVMEGRQGGYSQLWIIVAENDNKLVRRQLNFDESSYTVSGSVNRNFDTDKFRYVYSSMTTPWTTFDYDINTGESKLLKEKPVPSYDRSLYKTERIEAKASDGSMIPISIVYRSDLRSQDRQPLHLYGYGSYDISIDPSFSTSILPLLDRGVIYAIAHVRGGGEMGRTWYEGAKYTKKMNTFTDFISCAEHLVNTGYSSPNTMTCEGGSAGGLLIGAVLNMRPDLFTAAIAGVPFVDVMNTMSDATIPLTTEEWEEWGNPNEKAFFEYMLSYSPYENVKQQAYPNILVTSGLYDPRVAYWEPAKWVAKLRDMKSDRNEVLLKMDLSSGHFSASDRYHYLKEKAFNLAYLLDHLITIMGNQK